MIIENIVSSKFIQTLICILIPILFLGSCKNDEEANLASIMGSRGNDGGEISLFSPAPIPLINPLKNRTWQARSIYYLLYDNLIDVDRNLQFVPRLAKSWEISADAKKITFHLRDDVHWHNDRLFNADDVIYCFENYKKVADPERPGHNLFDKVVKIENLNPYTVTVTYDKSYTFALADWIVEIVPKPGADATPTSLTTAGPVPLGSGPYYFAGQDTTKNYLTFKVFESYWNGRSHLDQIKVCFSSPEKAKSSLQAGELDHYILRNKELNKDDLKQFRKKFNLIHYTSLEYHYIGWQCDGSNPFFNHRRIRKAMTLALNRKKLLQNIYQGVGVLCDVPLPPWAIDENIRSLPYSPALAVDLLREVECKDENSDGIREFKGQDFNFTLLYQADDVVAHQIVPFYQDSLRKIGIIMKPLGLSKKEMQRRIAGRLFDAYLLSDTVSLSCSNLELFTNNSSEGGQGNVLGYQDPTLDALVDKLFKNASPNDIEKYINLVIDRIIQEQPGTFVFFHSNFIAMNKKIEMVAPCPRGLWEWYPSILDWYIPR
ncbi:ABC transporter substrate-binding protein [candidate division CSSED10-310 bacterium]|uniref:ABC transporter substrate-binding protein n=1 Tax=candidate division CSSED10-310 bacterium TaxID=2855610 RepID=A0ABV6YXU9_UNCC1